MEKKLKRESKWGWILKSMLASYIVTGILLMVLAFLLYKMDLDKAKVSAGIIVIYVVSAFVGGFLMGKMAKVKKFLWGLGIGAAYFLLLFLISFGVYHTVQGSVMNTLTAFLLCAGGGMLGGMLS
ncbi:TIGR04086 family membrane protein [Lachnoclostridium sp. An181]|uniref:TIGR04086 family membrane protein n=1 Tax=Lachnoclostridium sp. An181 TaxID=1965575 RepID=UPI000B37C694|nr:TIGR04086 family membrane protein [Lachnoclostridium sp. An181]OUP50701.1 hypothetical protein B5F18_03460 [Lachnoclostridium sp. An181]